MKTNEPFKKSNKINFSEVTIFKTLPSSVASNLIKILKIEIQS